MHPIMFIMVVLPDPDGPTIDNQSPCFTVRPVVQDVLYRTYEQLAGSERREEILHYVHEQKDSARFRAYRSSNMFS